MSKAAEVDATAASIAAGGAVKAPRRGGNRMVEPRQHIQARVLETRIWNLVAQGRMPGAIARELRVKSWTVYSIIRRIEKRYEEMTIASVAELKVRQERMLELIVDESMEAWKRSQLPASKVTKEKGTIGKGGEPAEIDVTKSTVEKQIGDHRFLTEARAALADIRTLRGLDAPKAVFDPSGLPAGSGSFKVEWSSDQPPEEPRLADEYLPEDEEEEPEPPDEDLLN